MSSCVLAVMDLVLFSTFRPEDDFVQKTRKATVLALMSAGIVSVVTPYYIVDGTTRGTLATQWGGLGLSLCTVLFVVVVNIPAYIYIRKTKTAPDWLANFVVSATFVLATVASLVEVAFPTVCLLTTSVFALTMLAPVAPFLVVLCLPVFIIDGINKAYGYPAMLNAHRGPPLEQVLVKFIFDFAAHMTACFACYMYSREFNHTLKSLHAAQDVVRDAAQALAMYDTAAVRGLLIQYKEMPTKDEVLLDSLETLVGNLEKYRAFLPTYVLPSQSRDDDEEGDREVDLSSDGNGMHSKQHPRIHAQHKRAAHVSSLGGSVLSRGSSNDGGGGPPGAEPAYDDLSRPTAAFAKSGSKDRLDQDREGSNGRLVSQQPAGPTTASAANSADGGARRSTATVAMIRVDPMPDSALEVDAFATEVHSIGRKYGASLHSFIGNTLVVSWNAAKPTFRSEAKAANFVREVRKAFRSLAHDEDSGDILVRGAICTGKVRTQLAGDEHQRTLIVSAQFQSRLDAIFRGALETKAILCDYNTSENIKFDYVVRAIGVISCVTAPPNRTPPASGGALSSADSSLEGERDAAACRLAYEIVRARGLSGLDSASGSLAVQSMSRAANDEGATIGDSEWLYVVGSQAEEPEQLVTTAIACLAAGQQVESDRTWEMLRAKFPTYQPPVVVDL